MLFADAEFAGGAEHAHGHDAAQLGLLDLEVARQDGADRGAGDLDAGAHVRGAADDLSRRAVAQIDRRDMQLIGIGMLLACKYVADDHSCESSPDRFRLFECLDFQPDVGQNSGGLLGVEVGFDILFEPVE